MSDPCAQDERRLIAALRGGDERAFESLIEAYNPALLRVAMAHVPTRATAEEVVQETWLGVLRGLDRFEGRSSLKTWIFRILTNIAKTHGARERRAIPFSALAADEAVDGPVVDRNRFLPFDHSLLPGQWSSAPVRWRTPEDELLAGESRRLVLAAIADLPTAQRTVIGLRDVDGWPADDVCEVLGISEGNQRVLLHRARAKVRAALERYLAAPEPPPATSHRHAGRSRRAPAAARRSFSRAPVGVG